MNGIYEIAEKVKTDSFVMASLSEEQRNAALKEIASALQCNKESIISANKTDLEDATSANLSSPVIKRLKFDEAKLEDAILGINNLISLIDPIGQIKMKRELDEGLILEQLTCPIGVIGVIFESRPDALVQIAALCLKSGNCAILKGGSEAKNTNRALYDVIKAAGIEAGLPEGFITLLESRDEIYEMLKCHEYIDLIIPRGSNEFVRYIMDNSDIPVMGHSDGICHIYVDKNADIEKAIPIICDSKTQYVAACNAVETLLVHEDAVAALLPKLGEALGDAGVSIRGSVKINALIPNAEIATDADFETEYLDYIISIKVVDNIDEAIAHINKYGSHHTDCIVTEDGDSAEKFMKLVDSAGVYQNCSTRFADGFRYGLGAEVGISTGKLHARGPVGLEGLQTYKYRLYGQGHIVADYAEDRRHFNFKELDK